MSLRAWLAVGWLLGLAQLAAPARAEFRFAVRPFEGPNAARVRSAVVQACQEATSVEIVDNARLEGAAAALHVDLDTDEGRDAVARELQITVFMDGRVQRSGRQLLFVLETYRGRGGEKVGEGRVQARSAPQLAALARRRLSNTLQKLSRLPEQPEMEPAADLTITEAELERDRELEAQQTSEVEAAADTDRDPELESGRAAPDAAELEDEREGTASTFELSAGIAAISRDFAYRDDRSDLSEHGVSSAPMACLALRVYPLAHVGGDGIAANIGLYASGQLMLPVSATEGALVYQTEHRELAGGARLRVPIGRSELGLHAGLGASDVHIGDSQFDGDPEVPSVAYRFARIGGDARIALGADIQLGLGAAYLYPFAYGEIADARWFPHVSGGGVDAEVSAGYVLSSELTLQVALGMTRYFMSLNPEPDDRSVRVMHRIAGGAADQQLHLGIGASVRL
jgi:hypothetical protein